MIQKNKQEIKELKPSKTFYDCPVCKVKNFKDRKVLKGQDRKPDDDIDSVDNLNKFRNCGILDCGK